MKGPSEGERWSYRAAGLPGGLLPGVLLDFLVDRGGGAIVLHVPGNHAGPDNCTPQLPAQADWLDGLKHLMHRTWGCQWDLEDVDALETFMALLTPFLVEVKRIL